MSETTNQSNLNQLSAEVLQMIEDKRRQALERRKQLLANKQTANASALVSKPQSHPMPTSSTSSRETLTNIKPKKSLKSSEVPNKKTKSDDHSSQVTKTSLKASIRLLSNKRFELDITYDQRVVSVLRQIPSRDWNPGTKRWSFDLNDYKKLLSDLRNFSDIDFQFSDTIPERIINALLESKNRLKEPIDLSTRLGPKLTDKLYAFQSEGIKFAIRTGGRCLIADDMGLGKTIQSIGIAQWFREDWPLLIVCPSSLRLQWRDSLIEYLPNITSKITIVEKVNHSLPKIPITIISYDLMARMRSQFTLESKQIYNFVILDESHYIKTDSAARTEAVQLLAKSSKRVILLTGTPALSRPMELFTQIRLIDPKLFTSKHEFGVRYCDAQLKKFWQRGGRKRPQIQVWDYKGAKNLDELKIILEATLLVRRLKTEVLQELPNKKREMIVLNVNHLDEKKKNKLKLYANIIKKFSFKPSSEDNTSLFEWYQESAVAKIEPVCEYLNALLNKNIKLLCFCHHKQLMDGIEEVLANMLINHIRIDGSTPSIDRQEACHEFQTKPDCRVALLSLTACATGLNLTAASTVVFAELFWNPGILSQAEDRVHRIGQKSDVKIYYLVARNTIDDMIWPMISKKLEVLNKAGLSKDNFDSATTALDSIEAQQHLITEFFESLNESEKKALMEDFNDFND